MSKKVITTKTNNTRFNIDELAKEYYNKYKKFKALDEDFVRELIADVVNDDISYFEINSEIRKEIDSYLCEQAVMDEDEDIIIELEEMYMNKFNLVLRKLHVEEKDIQRIREDVLLNLIYEYDGSETFSIAFVRCAKKYFAEQKRKQLDVKPKTLEQVITNLPNLSVKTEVNDLIYIGNQLQIINKIPLDDVNYVKFVVYYFGFLGYYASDAAIKKQLDISDETFINYVFNSYCLLREQLKKQLGLLYESNIGNEKIKQF